MDSTLDRLLPSGHNYSSYISASYVQWAESGGARVVPVIIGKVDLSKLLFFMSVIEHA